jgi:hypothetical protein
MGSLQRSGITPPCTSTELSETDSKSNLRGMERISAMISEQDLKNFPPDQSKKLDQGKGHDGKMFVRQIGDEPEYALAARILASELATQTRTRK